MKNDNERLKKKTTKTTITVTRKTTIIIRIRNLMGFYIFKPNVFTES